LTEHFSFDFFLMRSISCVSYDASVLVAFQTQLTFALFFIVYPLLSVFY